MSRNTYSITAAQGQLPRLVREAEQGRLIAIRRRDETVAYLVSQEQLDAIIETMELLANPEARTAIEDHRAGRTRFVPLSEIDDE
jgi:PHD/YefM family antitoxin component YafN of YafNO toxin-antitoxin module